LVIAQIGHCGVGVNFIKNGIYGIPFIFAGNAKFDSTVEVQQAERILVAKWNPTIQDTRFNVFDFLRGQASPMNRDPAGLQFYLALESIGTQRGDCHEESHLLIAREHPKFVTAVGFEAFQAMAPPDFWVRMNTAKKKHFSRRASADENDARSLRHDTNQQVWHFGIRESEIAIGAKRSQSTVIIEEKDTSGGGPKAVQERRVTGLTLECLHAGS
jgi:hypothetical protein